MSANDPQRTFGTGSYTAEWGTRRSTPAPSDIGHATGHPPPRPASATGCGEDHQGRWLPPAQLSLLAAFQSLKLIENGANPKEVMVEMGHSNITDEDADTRRAERAERLATKLRS